MFNRNVVPVYIGTVLFSCMLLVGQNGWPQTCVDLDVDGYGDPASAFCEYPEWDCNDTNPQVNPGVQEGPFGDPSCSDGLNNDCDWDVDTGDSGCCECIDNDGDGYGDPGCENCTYAEWDCDDTNANVYPGAEEDCANGIDDDCDEYKDGNDGDCPCVDDDGDGYGVFSNPNCTPCDWSRFWMCHVYGIWPCCVDCDDTNPQVNPGVQEGPFGDPSCSDGLDNDCDGYLDGEDPSCCECIDNDGDGFGDPGCENCTYAEWDCDDTNTNIKPWVLEDCTNGIDDNCNGDIDNEDWECPLLAVTDDSAGENSTLVSFLLKIGENTIEIQKPAYFSGKVWCRFDPGTGLLELGMNREVLRARAIDFSLPVWFWKIQGTLKDIKVTAYSFSTYVDPSNGSFTTSIYLDAGFVISAYIGDRIIADDWDIPSLALASGQYFLFGPFTLLGTFIDMGDSDANGANEYELTLNGPVSLSLNWGEIPLIGEITTTISGEVNFGFIAETLVPDSYEPDNFPENAKLLLPGEVQSHVIPPWGDVDWIKVNALEGSQYKVEAFNENAGNCDSCPMDLEVYDDGVSPITSVYPDVGEESRVSWTATYTGIYYVKALRSKYTYINNPISYDIGFSCWDLDGDGYGDPGSVLCTYPEADCDDTNRKVNPEATEGPLWNPKCRDGLDNDCNGLIDGADIGCQYSGVANAEASSYGKSSLMASGLFNSLALLIVPVGLFIFLRIFAKRRKKSGPILEG